MFTIHRHLDANLNMERKRRRNNAHEYYLACLQMEREPFIKKVRSRYAQEIGVSSKRQHQVDSVPDIRTVKKEYKCCADIIHMKQTIQYHTVINMNPVKYCERFRVRA